MNLERLLMLAKKLDSVPPDSFNMHCWYYNDFIAKTSCGFEACAAGWAATIPEFAEAGFVIEFGTANNCYPAFEQYSGFEALESFFGINVRAANYLFSSNDNHKDSNKPWYVAKKIREFVSDNI